MPQSPVLLRLSEVLSRGQNHSRQDKTGKAAKQKSSLSQKAENQGGRESKCILINRRG